MFSRFFIARPVLTAVVILITLLLGLLSLMQLEIARYPSIAPPAVSISLSYPGASASTLEHTVSQVVEQQMTGLDNLLYFRTRANSEGRVSMNFYFDPSVNPDVAQMQVQNRLDTIMSSLPEAVQRSGARIRKVSDDTLQNIAFYATDGSLSQEDVADFLASVVQDPLSRLNGVGQVTLRGSQYAIRIWLNHPRLYEYALNPSDVVAAIEKQNQQVSAGQLGALPSVENQPLNINVKSRQLLETVTDFENLLLKVDSSGAAVYLKDVATVEMGRENYTYFGNYNGRPMAALQIELSEGANAVTTAGAIEELLRRLRPLFPDKLTYAYAYDTVPFVKVSLYEVTQTLIEALLLVALVLYIFLRSLRAMLIVALTVPVVLSGTVCVLFFMGYSINTLTMFAMVLAIGLLVDDAIVVVENITRLVSEEGLSVPAAAVRSMQEIAPALIGVGLVIAAVFTPMGFFPGAVGNIYKQFSVTIVAAMLLSVLTAILVTPSLCARFLKVAGKADKLPADGEFKARSVSRSPFTALLNLFDGGFRKSRELTLKAAACAVEHLKLSFLTILLCTVLCGGLYVIIPSSFLPVEDQSVLSARIVMPPGTTQEVTAKVALDIEDYFRTSEKEYVEGVMLSLGTGGGSASGQATAQLNIRLKHWDERVSEESSAQAILRRAKARFDNVPDAKINFSLPASVRGLGSSSGFDVYVQNVNGHDHAQFLSDVQEIVQRANDSVRLFNVRYEVQDDAPELIVSMDDLKAGQYGVDLDTLNENLEIAWGGKYVNDFVDRGRIKSVYVQSAPEFRSLPSDLNSLYLRNAQGQMVSAGAIVTTSYDYGPKQLERFNGVAAIGVTGDPAPGVSSGEAMAEIARIINAHPGNYGYAWSGSSYQEQTSGQLLPLLFSVSALIVFLCLAALYESWSIPLSVILILPLGVLGALGAIYLRSLTFDVYLQVGLLTTGGLAAKNAILIVEYAASFHHSGMSLKDSALLALRQRFRPIIMTSVAFLLGVLPLATATGAGAASQQSIGTGVLGGTLMATVLGVILVPAFFVMVGRLFDKSADGSGTASKEL